jgi:light-regulated signal transduction histidine kinase (bacteriophytochrome)
MMTVFQNLITNAIKYNDSEEKIIEIGADDGGDHTADVSGPVFHVRDNGIGIDDAFKDEVFRIFKRLNAEKAYGEGTGAGLTFVKKIIENHGGKIWLESAPGEGTTFYFTLARGH